MNSLTDENIIKSIFENFTLKGSEYYYNKIYNKELSIAMLHRIINYDNIFAATRKAKIMTKDDKGRFGLSLLPNGSVIEISKKNFKFWDMNNFKSTTLFNDAISTAKLPTDHLVSFAPSGEINIWKIENNNNLHFIKTITLPEIYSGYRKNLFCLSNGNLACYVYRYYQDLIFVLDSKSDFKIIKTLNLQPGFINSIVNISNLFASGSDNGTINIWESDDYNLLTTINAQEWNVGIKALLAVEKSNLLISGSSKHLKAWYLKNVGDGNNISTQCVHSEYASDGVSSLLLLPGGYFILGSNYGFIRIYNLINFQRVKVFEEFESPVNSMLLLRDNRIVASTDSEIMIWDY
jgi:WD40 repeat protein